MAARSSFTRRAFVPGKYAGDCTDGIPHPPPGRSRRICRFGSDHGARNGRARRRRRMLARHRQRRRGGRRRYRWRRDFERYRGGLRTPGRRQRGYQCRRWQRGAGDRRGRRCRRQHGHLKRLSLDCRRRSGGCLGPRRAGVRLAVGRLGRAEPGGWSPGHRHGFAIVCGGQERIGHRFQRDRRRRVRVGQRAGRDRQRCVRHGFGGQLLGLRFERARAGRQGGRDRQQLAGA